MRRSLFVLLLLVSSCVPYVRVPDSERAKVEAEFIGQRRWLRVAAYAGPLFDDKSKVLVTDAPGVELDLLEDTSGTPIRPPAPERILAPGTPVYVRAIEFPTGWTIARRVVMSPRYHPWVLLDVEGDARPYVLVLSQKLDNSADVRAEIDRMLSSDDSAPSFRALPEPQRAAILKKEPIEGMGTRGLEMAWGYPEKKIIDRPAGTEEWSWAEGRRRAFFQNGRLQRWDTKLSR